MFSSYGPDLALALLMMMPLEYRNVHSGCFLQYVGTIFLW